MAFDTADGREHAAVIQGEVRGKAGVPIRLHSECFTGDVMGVYAAIVGPIGTFASIHFIEEAGVVVYLRQEGRGIGLANKIRAYALQDQGMDTVEANLALGFQDDERTYDVAANIIRALEIASVKVMTNNPKKIEGRRKCEIVVDGRIPVVAEQTAHNTDYLECKKAKSGHLL